MIKGGETIIVEKYTSKHLKILISVYNNVLQTT